jgi:ubiquinone/menaquinone biosynthesis C-methylase UbiE
MECAELPQAAFDLAYISLALHYVEDLGGLLAKVHRALTPGGQLIFNAV